MSDIPPVLRESMSVPLTIYRSRRLYEGLEEARQRLQVELVIPQDGESVSTASEHNETRDEYNEVDTSL